MARPSFGPQARNSNGKKKTRQGLSKNTKYGNKLSNNFIHLCNIILFFYRIF